MDSILAQFFPYRAVYLFSSFLALALIGIAAFSVRSKYLKHIYNIGANTGAQRKKEGGSPVAFLVKPSVLAAFFFLIIPYVASLSFTGYFMSVYGIENGLGQPFSFYALFQESAPAGSRILVIKTGPHIRNKADYMKAMEKDRQGSAQDAVYTALRKSIINLNLAPGTTVSGKEISLRPVQSKPCPGSGGFY